MSTKKKDHMLIYDLMELIHKLEENERRRVGDFNRQRDFLRMALVKAEAGTL